jgi:hypothetical protein
MFGFVGVLVTLAGQKKVTYAADRLTAVRLFHVCFAPDCSHWTLRSRCQE